MPAALGSATVPTHLLRQIKEKILAVFLLASEIILFEGTFSDTGFNPAVTGANFSVS